MDIGSINANYADYLSKSATASSQIDKLKNVDVANSSDEELMGACKQFEEYFVEMVLKEVFKTVDITGISDSTSSAMSTSKEWMRDSMVQQFASKITEDSKLGLAQQLYESMKRNTISVEELPEE